MFKSIIPIILILTSIGITYVYAYPQFMEIQVLQSDIVKIGDALSKSDQVDIEARRLARIIEEFSEEYKDKLETILPRKIDTILLSNDINGIALRHSITISGLSISSAKNVKNATNPGINPDAEDSDTVIRGVSYNTTNISFSFRADYETLLEFLSDIEKSNQLFDIVSLSLGQGGEEGYSYKIDLITYSLAP